MTSLTALMISSTMMMGQLRGEVPLPPDIVEQIQYVIGDWEMSGKFGDVELKGTWSCAWSPSNHSYIITCSRTSDPVSHMSSLGGYDPYNKQIIEMIFWSDGSHYTITYDASKPIKDKGVAKGVIKGCEYGKEMEAAVKVERRGPDMFVYSAQGSDGTPVEIVFRKVKKG